MKNKIKETIVVWDCYELDGNLSDAIKKLQDVIDSNKNHFDFTIDIEGESGYYDSYSYNIVICAYRWETDEEFEKRKEADKNKKEKERIEKIRMEEQEKVRERSLYESLKRKFEKEINEGQK